MVVMRFLVTGASGLVGAAMLAELSARGAAVRAASRRAAGPWPSGIDVVPSPELGPDADWSAALAGVEVVIHAAARVHLMQDDSHDPLADFRRSNCTGTLVLARQAAAAGVRRLVFLSSIKVNGESGHFRADDIPAPQDPYGVSKWEAEQGLQALAAVTGLEIVLLRLPLVYGPGVRANFLRLMEVVERGWPLPLGAIDNRRSLIFLGNLTSAVLAAATHPAAAGHTYLLSDGEDLSTPELVRRLAIALHRPARLVPVPPAVMRLAGRLLGKAPEVARLLGSLSVDSGPIRAELGWTPPHAMRDGLAATARWYLGRKR